MRYRNLSMVDGCLRRHRREPILNDGNQLRAEAGGESSSGNLGAVKGTEWG